MKQLLRLLAGDVTYHATACDGLRSCDKECDRPFYNLQKDGTGKECKQKCEQPFSFCPCSDWEGCRPCGVEPVGCRVGAGMVLNSLSCLTAA